MNSRELPPPAVICADSAYVEIEELTPAELASHEEKVFKQWVADNLAKLGLAIRAYSTLQECHPKPK